MTSPPSENGLTGPIRLLHVDDDPSFTTMSAALLERQDDRFDVVTAAGAEDGLARLAAGDVDCIVSDYDMPGKNGLAFLEAVRAEWPDLPFVLFTGKGSEEVASAAISAGVTDYLQKGTGAEQYEILANRVANAVEKYRAVNDLERRSSQYEALSSLGRRALAGLDLDALFESAAELVSECLGTPLSKVLELLPDGDALLLRSGVGWDEGLVGQATVGADRNSQAGYTLEQATPVLVEDFETEGRFSGPQLLTDHGVVCGISVVIGSASDPWGVLGTHDTTRRTFTPQDVTFVENVANVLAAAIDRHETETRLRESERRFREIAELSPDGVFRLDTAGVFTYVSPASEEMLGNPPGGALGTEFREYVTEDTMGAAFEGYSRAIAGEVVRGTQVRIRHPDGSVRDVEVGASPIYDEGEVVAIQGIARDVTERKRRERALQQSRAHYEALVENLPNGAVFLFDRDMRFTLTGGEDLEETGVPPEVVVGRKPSELFPPENAMVLEAHYQATLAGEPQSFEDAWQGRTYQIETVPIRNADGEIAGGMAVAQNVTDRKRHERALERRTERLDEFASVVSHDLRNPLSVVRGRLELAQMECDSDHLDTAERAAGRMAALIEDLLELAREGREVKEKSPVEVPSVVEDCWRYVEAPSATLVVETEATILADEGRLRQLFENLFRNAVEHGSTGSQRPRGADDSVEHSSTGSRPGAGDSVEHGTGKRVDVTVTVGDLPDGSGFFVEDDGPGIAPEDRERVTEPGYSTSSEGTGFGLNIVAAIAEAHGWTLTVTESATGGARFEIAGVAFG